MSQSKEKYGSLWTRDETTLCFYLYCQIPFSRTNKSNAEVVKLATLLGRTVGSVVRKLGNLGAVDERLRLFNISGLTNYAKLDKEIFDEYVDNWEALVVDSARILENLNALKRNSTDDLTEELAAKDIVANLSRLSLLPTETKRLVNVRIRQAFFRRSVLSNYNNRCCVSKLDLPALLVASHIVPWSINNQARIDPQNGLLLSTIHDKAYDIGLITITTDLRIKVSDRVRVSKSTFIKPMLLDFDGQEIDVPTKFLPKKEYLEWHHKNRFIK